MNELIAIGTDRRMSTREIAELTGKEHKNVLRDVRNLIERGAIDRLSFEPISYKDRYGREQEAYELNFKATMTLITGYDAPLRSKVIDRWYDLETGSAAPALETPEQIMAKAILIAQDTIARQRAQIDEYRPKALFADAVSTSQTCILVGELAKLLKQNGIETGQQRLFEDLRQGGWLIKTGSDRNMPTQKSMERGLFEIKERTVNSPDGTVRITKTPKVTGKGQVFFVNLYLKRRKALPAQAKESEVMRRNEGCLDC